MRELKNEVLNGLRWVGRRWAGDGYRLSAVFDDRDDMTHALAFAQVQNVALEVECLGQSLKGPGRVSISHGRFKIDRLQKMLCPRRRLHEVAGGEVTPGFTRRVCDPLRHLPAIVECSPCKKLFCGRHASPLSRVAGPWESEYYEVLFARLRGDAVRWGRRDLRRRPVDAVE